MSDEGVVLDRQCTASISHGARAGERCSDPAAPGVNVCMKHGAALPAVQKSANEVLAQARMFLVLHAGDAAQVLHDLMNSASTDATRLKAAESLLDRVGVRGGTELHVSTDDSKARAADVISERLNRLRGNAPTDPEPHGEPILLELPGVDVEPLEGELLPPLDDE